MIHYGTLAGRRVRGDVVAIEKVPPSVLPRIFRSTSASDGNFQITVPPGSYQVALINRGVTLYPNNSQPQDFVISDGEEQQNIIFPPNTGPSVELSGSATTPNGRLITSVITTLVSADYPYLAIARNAVVRTGIFRYEGIYPGNYDLLVASLPNQPVFYGRKHIVVNGESPINIPILMEAGLGTKLSLGEGGCARNVSVTLTPIDAWTPGPPITKTASLISASPVSITGLYPGFYEFSSGSSVNDSCSSEKELVDLRSENKEHNILLKPLATVKGTTTKSEETIVLRDLEPGRESPVRLVRPTNNEFEFNHLPFGAYCLSVQVHLERIDCRIPNLRLMPGQIISLKLE
jgi:hypothetical protein